jgi:hypothetical protein
MCMSEFVVYLTDVAKYSSVSGRKSGDLHKVIHCVLRASVIPKEKLFETEFVTYLQFLLSNILMWILGSRTILPDFVT